MPVPREGLSKGRVSHLQFVVDVVRIIDIIHLEASASRTQIWGCLGSRVLSEPEASGFRGKAKPKTGLPKNPSDSPLMSGCTTGRLSAPGQNAPPSVLRVLELSSCRLIPEGSKPLTAKPFAAQIFVKP